MAYPFNLSYSTLLAKVLEDAGTGTKEDMDILTALHQMKATAIIEYRKGNHDIENYIFDIECNFRNILDSSLRDDPRLFKLQETPYLVNGTQVTFKPDTGAKDCVLDAREIKWTGADLKQLEEIHLEFAEEHPKEGMLDQKKIKEYLPQYQEIKFGTLESFLMPVHKGKDDKGYADVKQTDMEVVAIANPKNSSGKRVGLRPVVEMTLFDEVTQRYLETRIALTDRTKMTARGLLGIDFFKKNFDAIVMPDANTKTIDIEKINYEMINNVIEHYPKVFSL
jgi:hypothetical protein